MKRLICGLLALSTLAAPSLAFAQAAASPSIPFAYVSVTMVTVKPNAVAAFEDFAKKINAAAVKAGLRPTNFYSVSRGGPGFTYVGALRFTKWSELDERPPVSVLLNKVYGAEAAKMLADGGATVESLSTYVMRVLPSVSSPPAAMDTPPKHIRISRVEVQQGMGTKFEGYLAKLKAAQDKVGGTPPVVRYVNVLGRLNTYTAAYYFDSYGAWDAAPSVTDVAKKAYGDAEAAKLEEAANAAIKSLEVQVVDYRPDLSRP